MSYTDIDTIKYFADNIPHVQDLKLREMLEVDCNVRFYAYFVECLKSNNGLVSDKEKRDVIRKTYKSFISDTYLLYKIFGIIRASFSMDPYTEANKLMTPYSDEVVAAIRMIRDHFFKDINKNIRKVMMRMFAVKFDRFLNYIYWGGSDSEVIYKILDTDKVIDSGNLDAFVSSFCKFVCDPKAHKCLIPVDLELYVDDVKDCIKEMIDLFISKMEDIGYNVIKSGFKKNIDHFELITYGFITLSRDTFVHGIKLNPIYNNLDDWIYSFDHIISQLGPILSPIDIMKYLGTIKRVNTYSWTYTDMIAGIHKMGLEMAGRSDIIEKIKLEEDVDPLEYYDVLTETLTLDLITGFPIHKSVVIPGIGIMLNNWTVANVRKESISRIDVFIPHMEDWYSSYNDDWLAAVYYKIAKVSGNAVRC